MGQVQKLGTISKRGSFVVDGIQRDTQAITTGISDKLF